MDLFLCEWRRFYSVLKVHKINFLLSLQGNRLFEAFFNDCNCPSDYFPVLSIFNHYI